MSVHSLLSLGNSDSHKQLISYFFSSPRSESLKMPGQPSSPSLHRPLPSPFSSSLFSVSHLGTSSSTDISLTSSVPSVFYLTSYISFIRADFATQRLPVGLQPQEFINISNLFILTNEQICFPLNKYLQENILCYHDFKKQ